MNSHMHKQQRGTALVVSLMLLAVMTITTVASMRGSNLQERMAGNSNQQLIALMASEAGASEFYGWLLSEHANDTLDWDDPVWQKGWLAIIPGEQDIAPNAGSNGYYWVVQDDWGCAPDQVCVVVRGTAIADDLVLASTELHVIFDRPSSGGSEINPAFRRGMLSDKNITINGNSTFNGSIHANGDFSNTSGGSNLNDWTGVDENGDPVTNTSTITASGNANFGGSTNGDSSVTSNAGTVPVPSAQDFITQNMNNADVIQSCKIPSGDGRGATYYCDGNLTISSGSYSNVTIMASGNIRHNGASSLGASREATIALIAGGDIRVNGSSDTYGVFWAGGNLTQNGSSTLGGSIVTGGKIDINGAFKYTQTDSFSNLLPLPEVPLPDIGVGVAQWLEVR